MGSARLMILVSFVLACIAEAGFLANWWIMSSHAASGPGIATMAWAWPPAWLLLCLIASACLWLERRLGPSEEDLQQRASAAVMLLRLLSPALLIIGPGIIVFYSLVMVLTAVGVTSSQSVAG